MANSKQVKRLKRGMEGWNEWRRKNPDIKVNLRKANLEGADLFGADLREADLFGADLREADLGGADLREANLFGADPRGANLFGAKLNDANLFGANLFGANLFGADLREADLGGADLRQANLYEANLFGANLRGARIGFTLFTRTNLNGVKNMDTCIHQGPSSIDTHTLRASWPLPLTFLRGCGLEDSFIEYLPSLLGKALEFYSCFISYSSKDLEFVDRLHADLQNKGIRCWYAPEDMRTGDKIRSTIENAIRLRDKVLIVLSDNSINSDWCEDEVESAYEEESQTSKPVLFPIRTDTAVMETKVAWAAKLRRQRHVGNFENWRKSHEDYKKAFDRLLRDLRIKADS